MVLVLDSEHVAHVSMKTGLFLEDNFKFEMAVQTNTLERSTNRCHSTRAHVFLSYHLLLVPCFLTVHTIGLYTQYSFLLMAILVWIYIYVCVCKLYVQYIHSNM